MCITISGSSSGYGWIVNISTDIRQNLVLAGFFKNPVWPYQKAFLPLTFMSFVGSGTADQYKSSNAPSFRSPVVDEQTMTPGHWLGALYFPSVF